MSRTNPTWDDKPNRNRGNKLKSTAWDSVIAVFWFLAGVIGAICNYITKNKKGILDFCCNVASISVLVYRYFKPSKGGPKIYKTKAKSRK